MNKTLLVTAPPYNAKCDSVTDDKAGIHAAFVWKVHLFSGGGYPAFSGITTPPGERPYALANASLGTARVPDDPIPTS